MAQTFQGARPTCLPGCGLLPKGILKKKHISTQGATQGPEPGPSPANPGQAGPPLPKKGISLRARQRESGHTRPSYIWGFAVMACSGDA